jgi:hypothetical protein
MICCAGMRIAVSFILALITTWVNNEIMETPLLVVELLALLKKRLFVLHERATS